MRRVDAAQRACLEASRGWHPLAQTGVVLGFYGAHTLWLSRGCFLLPFQVVPNEFGLWQSVGYDSFGGGLVLFLRWVHVSHRRREREAAGETRRVRVAEPRRRPWTSPCRALPTGRGSGTRDA